MEKNMKVGIYVRVSTLQQTTDNQLLELYEVCERNDWTVVEEYSEVISGTKGVEERSELERMLIDASRRKFDKVVIWSVDRVARSMKHLIQVLSQLDDLDIDIYSYKQGIGPSTTMTKSFFHMVAIFAELENNLRSERQKIGIKRALDNGAQFGRKTIIDDLMISNVVQEREKGLSIRKIADELDLNRGVVLKICQTNQI
jgi:DNA invertase Pin-like site-specific DNA recombinase